MMIQASAHAPRVQKRVGYVPLVIGGVGRAKEAAWFAISMYFRCGVLSSLHATKRAVVGAAPARVVDGLADAAVKQRVERDDRTHVDRARDEHAHLRRDLVLRDAQPRLGRPHIYP